MSTKPSRTSITWVAKSTTARMMFSFADSWIPIDVQRDEDEDHDRAADRCPTGCPSAAPQKIER